MGLMDWYCYSWSEDCGAWSCRSCIRLPRLGMRGLLLDVGVGVELKTESGGTCERTVGKKPWEVQR